MRDETVLPISAAMPLDSMQDFYGSRGQSYVEPPQHAVDLARLVGGGSETGAGAGIDAHPAPALIGAAQQVKARQFVAERRRRDGAVEGVRAPRGRGIGGVILVDRCGATEQRIAGDQRIVVAVEADAAQLRRAANLMPGGNQLAVAAPFVRRAARGGRAPE